jgi:hypothetical protein
VLKGTYGDFFRYSVSGDSWFELRQYNAKTFVNREGKKKKPKDGASLVYYDGDVYMLKGGNTNEFWKYDIAANNWSQMDALWDIPAGSGKKVKSGGTMTLLNNEFYVAKGAKTPEFYKHAAPTKAIAAISNPEVTNEGKMGEKVTTNEFRLSIVPNPATNLTTISYNLPKAEKASLKLYSVYGTMAKSYNNSIPTKNGVIVINAKDLPAGVYMLRFNAGEIKVTRKIVLEK